MNWHAILYLYCMDYMVCVYLLLDAAGLKSRALALVLCLGPDFFFQMEPELWSTIQTTAKLFSLIASTLDLLSMFSILTRYNIYVYLFSYKSFLFSSTLKLFLYIIYILFNAPVFYNQYIVRRVYLL